MKRSDNPLCPFNPNYKTRINWQDMVSSQKNSESSSAYVNNQRTNGIEPAALILAGALNFNPRNFVIKRR